jgi:hypothetical protein
MKNAADLHRNLAKGMQNRAAGNVEFRELALRAAATKRGRR